MMYDDDDRLVEYTDILDVWAPGAIIGGATLYTNQETNMLASTITPTPPGSWLNAVDALITTLKTASIWQTIDLFYCFAAPSANACTYNWRNTAVGTLTANGTINYSANQYAAGDGSTGWFSSSFSANSGHASDGTAEFGYFVLNECSTDAVGPFQTSGGKSALQLQGDSTGATIPNLSASLNTSTAASFSSQWGSTVGHWVLQQNNTTQLQLFVDGTSIGTSTQTNSADSGTVQIFKDSAGAFTSRQTAFVHYGSSLTNSQQLTLSKALYTFLASMAVKPKAGYLGLSTGPTNVAPYKHLSTGNGNNLYMPLTAQMQSCEFQGRAGAYPYAAIVVNDPNYSSLLRLETHQNDYAPYDNASENLNRALFDCGHSISVSSPITMDCAFSIWIEEGSAYGDNFTTGPEWHDTTGTVTAGPSHAITVGPPNSLVPQGNWFVWGYRSSTATYINDWDPKTYASCAQGAWHHVRTTWRISDGTDGFIQSWFDGVQVLNYSGPVDVAANGPFYPALSCYTGNSAAPSPGPTAIWIANYEIDSSGTQPYSGRINSPLPVPPLQ